MVIAVYVDLKIYRSSNADLYFIKNLLHNLAYYHPQHDYFLIHPGAIDELGELDAYKQIHLKINPGLLYNYRINRKTLHTLNKIKADTLLSIDAVLKGGISQTILLTSSNRATGFSSDKLKKLKSIFVQSQQVKNTLETRFRFNAQKILVLHGGASKTFAPIDDEIKSLVKDKYTDGKEFFVYRGRIKEENNIVALLKAFSLFKKRQKSSMKLVLMGKLYWGNGDFKKLLGTYKYRDDVVMVTDELLTKEASILAAAYAFIQPYPSNNLFPFDAMKCEVPVLTTKESTLIELTSDGASFFDEKNEADMADKMMLLYRDESLRNRIIDNASKIIAAYSWEKTTELLAKTLAN
jgi:glycosyltransferase involved in cell wall biosynthesis